MRRRRKRDENTVLINTKENNKEPEQTSIVGTFRHVRLRHAKELLSVEPQKFVYSGSVSEVNYTPHLYTIYWQKNVCFFKKARFNEARNFFYQFFAMGESKIFQIIAVFITCFSYGAFEYLHT